MYELAQLARLAAQQNLALCPDAASVLARLAGPLSRYAEIELRSDARRIDLVTLTDDADVADEFLAVLAARGSSDSDLAALRSLQRFGAGATLGMKLPLAGPPSGGKLYIRTALPLAEVVYLLSQHDVPQAARDRVESLAALFDKPYVHMFAADASAAPTFNLFLTTWLEPGAESLDERIVRDALSEIGLPPAAIDSTARLHRALSAARPETLYFSWSVARAALPPSAKLDYAGVRLGLVAELFAAVGADSQARLLARSGRELQIGSANYAGLVVNETGPAEARAYFTRRATQ